MGAAPQPAKCFPPACNRHYLGTSVHVGDAFTSGCVHFQPKSTTTWKVLQKLQEAQSSGLLDRDSAGKLRGDLSWLWSMCAGHIGKLAGPILTHHQQIDDPTLSPMELWSLRLLTQVVSTASPRSVQIAGPLSKPVRVYSDASFEGGVLRLGWIIFRELSNFKSNEKHVF